MPDDRRPIAEPPTAAAGSVSVAVRKQPDARTGLLLGASLLVAIAAITAPWWGRFDDAPPLYWVQMTSGLGLLAAGVVAARWRSGRRIAKLLFISAFFYFIPFLSAARSDLVFTVAFALRGAWVTVGNHFVLTFPEGKLRGRFERTLVAAGYSWMVIGATLLTMTYDPRSADCPDCPRNLLAIVPSQEAFGLILYPAGLIPATIAGLALLALTLRWRRATRPERQVIAPVFGAFAINVVTTLIAYFSVFLRTAGIVSEQVQMTLFSVQQTMILLIPIAVIVGLLRSALNRSAIGNLLVRIGQGRSSDEIGRDIAWALGDPSSKLVYRRGEDGEFQRTDGRPIDRSRTITPIGESMGVAVGIVHDPAITEHHPELLEAVVAAARLALDNQRLVTELQLSRQLPSGLADRLAAQGAVVGETQTLTISVVMSDIRGYSTMAERADLRTLTRQLNEHRAAMNKVIVAQGGTVMQYAGDSVFAVFGAPEPVADPAPRAVRAALEMQSVQAAINQRWRTSGLPAFELGIGITTGRVAAALLGSEEHLEYSLVGDVVNLAQRIQTWARGGEVVMSEPTFEATGVSLNAEPLPAARVKGRASLVRAYLIRSEDTRAEVA